LLVYSIIERTRAFAEGMALEQVSPNMETSLNEFDRRLLQAIAKEPVPYEWLLDELSSETDGPSTSCSSEMIRDGILNAISRGLISACLLHAEPPFVTPTVATRETLPRYWFFCTARGRSFLETREKQTGIV
jgi:hypothetical protein